MRINSDCDDLSQIDPSSGEHIDRLTLTVRERLAPFIFGRLKDTHAAEDVLQETLLTMIERLGDLRRAECFWPWIFRVARRKMQDHFRRQERWATMKENARHESERRLLGAREEIGVLERMIVAENARKLSEAIRDLDVHQQQIVRLRCFEQMPYDKIAHGTRMSPGQARINLHRAKLRLKRRLNALSA